MRARRRHRHRHLRPRADALVKHRAPLRRQAFGIVEAARNIVGIENDGRRDDRTGKRPAPRFVASGDRPHPALERHALAPERRPQTISSPSGRRADAVLSGCACGQFQSAVDRNAHAAPRMAARDPQRRHKSEGGSLEQIELLRRRPRRPEMLGRGFHAGRIEAEPLAGDFEAAADHPGDRPEPVMRLPKVES